MDQNEILDKQRQYLWPNQLLYYTDPMPIDHGEDMYVWDVDGNKYLDFSSGIYVTSLGHCHPKISEAVSYWAKKLMKRFEKEANNVKNSFVNNYINKAK